MGLYHWAYGKVVPMVLGIKGGIVLVGTFYPRRVCTVQWEVQELLAPDDGELAPGAAIVGVLHVLEGGQSDPAADGGEGTDGRRHEAVPGLHMGAIRGFYLGVAIRAHRAVGGAQIAEALHVALHRPRDAHPLAHRALELGQHVLPLLDEPPVVTRAVVALLVHCGGVQLPDEVLIVVPHEAAPELQRGGEGLRVDMIELADGSLHVGGVIGGAEVEVALEEVVDDKAGGEGGGSVASGVVVVGGEGGASDDGGEEGVELKREQHNKGKGESGDNNDEVSWEGLSSPLQAAAAALAFSLGALVPLLASWFISSYRVRLGVVAVAANAALVMFGWQLKETTNLINCPYHYFCDNGYQGDYPPAVDYLVVLFATFSFLSTAAPSLSLATGWEAQRTELAINGRNRAKTDIVYGVLEAFTVLGMLHASLHLDTIILPYYTGLEALRWLTFSGVCTSCVCRMDELVVGGSQSAYRGGRSPRC
ncbi:hypothetical protein Cni_G29292 [Canna indica]|uniref:Uncharacterized protein n=1 Tax=Canna indica TaxID=4628 RepID=A0AAQ3L429_9LILI|nr:hypothetical protein Cni_G29292 [Canna indica]